MESNCGGCLSGAIVSYRKYGGRMLLRPYTDVRQWPLSFVRPRNVFRYVRPTPIRLCRKPFYGPMSFIRPRNVFRYVRPTPIRLCRKPFYGPMTPIRP